MFKCTKCKEPPYAERHVRWCERSENKGNRRKTPKTLCFPPTRLPAILSSPSTKTALLVDGPISAHTPPFRPSVPKNRHFSELTRHLHLDLPCQCPFSRKVLRFSGGPSMPGAVFKEGPAFFRGTFHARARFPGRFWCFQWDLPCQSPFSWKVPVQVLLVCAISGHLERKTLVLLLVYTISGHLEQ